MTKQHAIEIIWAYMKSGDCLDAELFDALQVAINELAG